MIRLIHGIRFGKNGVLIKYDTKEVFYPIGWFVTGSYIERTGCHVIIPSSYIEGNDYIMPFKKVEDAENFMTWINETQGG